jgi:signal transduction histidine kinase
LKDNTKIITIAALLGVIAWLVDSILNYFLCKVNSFCEGLVLGVPMGQFIARVEIVVILLLYGFWIAKRIVDKDRMDITHFKTKNDLGERVKELNFLYSISSLIPSPDTSLEEVFETAVYLIAYSWQNPEITCVRITLKDQVFATDNFQETSWGQTSEIVVQGEPVGQVEIFHLEKIPERDEKLFRKEEKFLVDTIAGQLAKIVGGVWAEKAIQRQVDYLAALNNSLQYFQANLEDVEKIQEGVCWLVIELFKVKMAWMGLVHEEDYDVHLAAASGFEKEHLDAIQSTWNDGTSGRDITSKAIKSGKPVVMQNVLTTEDFAAWRETAETCGYQSSATLPLVGGDRVIGVLNLYNEQTEFFDDELMLLLQLFADQVSVALSNAMLMEQIKAKRQLLQDLSRQMVESREAERQILASELQEKIGQILTGINLTLGAVEVPSDSAQSNLENAKKQISDIISQLRDMSQDLRPTMLDNSGLLPTLLWYFDRYNAQTGVKVEFTHEGIDRRFPKDKEITLYRVIQGLLTNVATNEKVKDLKIEVMHVDDRLKFMIEDQVMVSNNKNETNFGLIEMTERMNTSGGKLSITTPPGSGTLIEGELPVKGKFINRRRRSREDY